MGVITISSKPSRLLDWINDDSASKYTQPSAGEQLSGHVNDTSADPKIFNWCWWRLSQWTEYLNELELNQIPDSSDYKKIKTEDTTANRVDFDKLDGVTTTKTEVNQLSGVDVGGNLTGDILTTDDTQTLKAKTYQIGEAVNLTPTSTELNQLAGVTVGGSSAGDIVTLNATQALTNKTIDADNNTISNLEHGSEVDDLSSGVHGVSGTIVGTSDSQTLTTKTIDADSNTVSNLEHGSEVDNPTIAHGATGAIVGTTNEQTLTQKTLTSPKINEDTILAATSTEIDAAVASSTNAILGDGTSGRTIRCLLLTFVWDGTDDIDSIQLTAQSRFQAWTTTPAQHLDLDGGRVGEFELVSADNKKIIIYTNNFTGSPVGILNTSEHANRFHINGTTIEIQGLNTLGAATYFIDVALVTTST